MTIHKKEIKHKNDCTYLIDNLRITTQLKNIGIS